jgi:hypothetical protein
MLPWTNELYLRAPYESLHGGYSSSMDLPHEECFELIKTLPVCLIATGTKLPATPPTPNQKRLVTCPMLCTSEIVSVAQR